ncbi:protein of unknown function [Paenibacillus alvei]|uniref:Uncharacterized protein n=1 Tax=Paenibacillus alvei TaxID=44250 RepID=A0A383RLP9_PAEAL|nr:protein of unknown function [Paenibacillus alvei]
MGMVVKSDKGEEGTRESVASFSVIGQNVTKWWRLGCCRMRRAEHLCSD